MSEDDINRIYGIIFFVLIGLAIYGVWWLLTTFIF